MTAVTAGFHEAVAAAVIDDDVIEHRDPAHFPSRRESASDVESVGRWCGIAGMNNEGTPRRHVYAGANIASA